ncbi:uncharacterized protein [Euphorbia lathyris]|uniref:uncharacterized protein isoform X2 n=1 Tax=Euphorbia lathyris TaxID=212925 RepID=UPI0033134488
MDSELKMARSFKRQIIKSRRKAKKHARKSAREIDASKVHMPKISESKHRRSRVKKKVTRFPFLSAVQYAEFALACYERLNDPSFALACCGIQSDGVAVAENRKFEVVQALGACRALVNFAEIGVGDRCHVSFIAKPRNADGSDASPVFFFVELGDWSSGVLLLMHFRKSQPDDPEITYGCGFCPSGKEYPHLEGYLGGLESVPVDATSQREMARCFKRQIINSRRKVKPKRNKEPVRTYLVPNLPEHEYAEIALKFINGKEEASRGLRKLENGAMSVSWLNPEMMSLKNLSLLNWLTLEKPSMI